MKNESSSGSSKKYVWPILTSFGVFFIVVLGLSSFDSVLKLPYNLAGPSNPFGSFYGEFTYRYNLTNGITNLYTVNRLATIVLSLGFSSIILWKSLPYFRERWVLIGIVPLFVWPLLGNVIYTPIAVFERHEFNNYFRRTQVNQVPNPTSSLPVAFPTPKPCESNAIPALNIAFAYPAKLGECKYTSYIFSELTSLAQGKRVEASIGSKLGERAWSISITAQGKDFITDSDTPASFENHDGYAKTDKGFTLFDYRVVADGQKSKSYAAEKIYSNVREVKTQNLTALVVEYKKQNPQEVQDNEGLREDIIGAIVPLPSTSGFYALNIQGDLRYITTDEFLAFVKSIRSTQ